MGAIEQLIKVKKQSNHVDIIDALAEVAIIDKLSKSKSFTNIASSPSVQKKVPFIWSALNNDDIYAKSLLRLAGNITMHLVGDFPEIITECMGELGERDAKRLDLLQKHSIQVEYHALYEYNDETMSDKVVGIYSHETDIPHQMSILIIVADTGQYRIYQGFYMDNAEVVITNTNTVDPFILDTQDGYSIQIDSYSLQGNNAYPFGRVCTPSGTYLIMMPVSNTLALYSTHETNMFALPSMSFELTPNHQYELNTLKTSVAEFARILLDVVKEGSLNNEETN